MPTINQLLKKREAEGRSKQPISVVISSERDFCTEWPFFSQPIQKWIIRPQEIKIDLEFTVVKSA